MIASTSHPAAPPPCNCLATQLFRPSAGTTVQSTPTKPAALIVLFGCHAPWNMRCGAARHHTQHTTPGLAEWEGVPLHSPLHSPTAGYVPCVSRRPGQCSCHAVRRWERRRRQPWQRRDAWRPTLGYWRRQWRKWLPGAWAVRGDWGVPVDLLSPRKSPCSAGGSFFVSSFERDWWVGPSMRGSSKNVQVHWLAA
jgi:hypothetical protein